MIVYDINFDSWSLNMTGRGGKRRGRPPKSVVMERPKKFQYHLMKKPKYLQNKGSETPSSQPSTPTASRATSPVESEESRRSTRSKKLKGARDRHSRKGKNFGEICEILRLVLKCLNRVYLFRLF